MVRIQTKSIAVANRVTMRSVSSECVPRIIGSNGPKRIYSRDALLIKMNHVFIPAAEWFAGSVLPRLKSDYIFGKGVPEAISGRSRAAQIIRVGVARVCPVDPVV